MWLALSAGLLFHYLGYLFGNMPIVKDNFTHLIFGIIIISILPGVIGFIRQKLNNRKAQ
jgi:membrane-associated protein